MLAAPALPRTRASKGAPSAPGSAGSCPGGRECPDHVTQPCSSAGMLLLHDRPQSNSTQTQRGFRMGGQENRSPVTGHPFSSVTCLGGVQHLFSLRRSDRTGTFQSQEGRHKETVRVLPAQRVNLQRATLSCPQLSAPGTPEIEHDPATLLKRGLRLQAIAAEIDK